MLELDVVLVVARCHADDALALAQEARGRHARGEPGAVRVRGPGDVRDQARIVLLRVVELHAADERIRAEPRRDRTHAAMGQVARGRNAARAADPVVQRETGAEVGALPAPVGQRPEERNGLHEVRREPRQQQLSLAERLANEPEVEHLEVTQAAVDELARLARRPGRVVARLDQSDAQSARDRVECRADARDPAADHEDVEHLCRHALDGLAAGLRIERAGRHAHMVAGRMDRCGDGVHAPADSAAVLRWAPHLVLPIWSAIRYGVMTECTTTGSSPTTPRPTSSSGRSRRGTRTRRSSGRTPASTW